MEALLLPSGVQESFLEDSLADLACSALKDRKLQTPDEAVSYTLSEVQKYIEVTTALKVSGAVTRIAMKVFLYANGEIAPQDGALAKLLKSNKIRETTKVPFIVLTTKDDDIAVTLRIPAIDLDKEPSKGHLESLLTLVHYGLGVKTQNISIVRDPSMGPTLLFEAGLLKVIDELSASVASPVSQTGNISNLGEYKGTLPGILASIHLLALKSLSLRKRSVPKGKQVFTVNPEVLRKTFNTRTGLSNSGTVSSSLLKAVLAEITSVSNRRFPGAWVSQNRALNNVKTDLALLFKMGYVEKVPHPHRLHQVLFSQGVATPSGKVQVKTFFKKEEKEHLSYPEFRAGTVMTCPKLDYTAPEAFKAQSDVEPLHVKNAETIKAYNDVKFFKAVDSLNRAAAILNNCRARTGKSTAVHFNQSRNEFINMCAHLPIIDCKGKTYSQIGRLPKPVLEHCQKTFRFKKEGEKKRPADEMVGVVEEAKVTKKTEAIFGSSTTKNQKEAAAKTAATTKDTPPSNLFSLLEREAEVLPPEKRW
jgi:hypothetical protein